MRLFIALPLTDPVLPALAELTQKLKADGIRGNFTRPENLHLTLHFLGESGHSETSCPQHAAESFR